MELEITSHLESTEPSPWITDLQEIDRRTELQWASHQKFCDFLKTKDSQDIDELVHQLSQDVSKKIDCTQCANCCRSLTVAVNYPDMTALAENLNLQIDDFKAKFMKKDPEKGMVFSSKPCPLLKDNLCTAYQNRPTTCRTYPHLEKERFISRLGNVLSNLKVCPIAFNTFELLKLNYE